MLSAFGTFLHAQLFSKIPRPTASFKDQTVIVTGASAGLGLHAVQNLVRLGVAHIIIAVRNVSKGEKVRDQILVDAGDAAKSRIEVWQVDMCDFASIRAFADRVQNLDRLDAVLLNAGIFSFDFELAEGYESTLTTNVLGTMLLAVRVLPVLRESARKTGLRGRLMFVGSDSIFLAPLPSLPETSEPLLTRLSKDVSSKQMVDRYALSKLLLLYNVRAMASKNPLSTDSNVVIAIMTPGLCKSNIFPPNAPGSMKIAMIILQKTLARTTEVGSWTLVSSIIPDLPAETHGKFIWDGRFVPDGPLVESKAATDLAKRWNNELFGFLENIEPGSTAR